MGGGAAADPHRHGPQPRCPDHLQPLQARGPIAVEKRRADPMPESTAVAPSEPQTDGAVGFSPPAAVRADRRAKTLETTALNLFYGDLQAVENVTMTIEPNKVTALIGSLGLRQDDLSALPQQDARADRRRPRRGPDHARRAGHLREGDRPGRGAEARRDGVS